MVNVIGFGIVCAIGNDASEVLCSLKEGRTGIGPMRYLQSNHKELPVGEVKLSNEDMKQMLGLDKEAIISRTVLLGAIAIRQALEQAQLTKDNGTQVSHLRHTNAGETPAYHKRIVLISGTTVGGMDITERYFKQIKENDSLLPLLEKHDCGSSTRQMADLAGLEDAEVCTISTACSSAVNAIILGSEMLKAGEADIVIAGGTEALSLFHLNGFNSLMILDKEQCRPFDKTRAGLNLGEGAAFVCLTPDSSPRRGEQQSPFPPLLGEGMGVRLLGYANRCDAFHQTASSENGEGAYLAMTEALQMAGLKPQDIHYINAHGTGTPNNDASESSAIRRVFGEHIPPVSSTKGFTGHTTSASGAIETVISILALLNDFIPTNLGWKEQDEECITPFDNSKFINSNIKAPSLTNILCNSFGFGGNDSALVIGLSPSSPHQTSPKGGFKIIGEAIILSPSGELEGALREFFSPGEARRMSKLMKAATITSLKALKEAGIETSDAIITATAYGMLETSERFLTDMLENDEETLSPTLFMQSTHNTIGSAIAIRTKCHGYNMTYTQGKDSFEWAMRDARRLIGSGKARTVLVGCHDEATPLFQDTLRRMGEPIPPAIYSRSIVLAAANN